MRISIVGTGYVGLVTGVCLAERGHGVVCVDVDAAKVEAINGGHCPIHEAGLQQLLGSVVGRGFEATTDLTAAVRAADVVILAVGTPFGEDRIDLAQIETAAEQVGQALRPADRYRVVVVKSTVVPGTTEGPVVRALERGSGLVAGDDFGVGMNPEFLREGSAVADFMEPDRIVVGGIDERSQDRLAEVYAPFPDVPLLRVDARTAEMIKYTSNALLATLISFSNEIGNLCAELGTDVTQVLGGVHLDRRLSPVVDGVRLTPGILTYLEAGCGFGGSCFPKDVKALVAHGAAHGEPMPLLHAVLDINAGQPQRLVDRLARHVPLPGATIAVLGAAFKPGTDDVRESPALTVIRRLRGEGAEVVVHDPIALSNGRGVLGDDGITYEPDLAQAVAGADGVLLVTAWPEYRDLPRLLAGRRIPVVDGRRFLDPDTIEVYEGIGMPASDVVRAPS